MERPRPSSATDESEQKGFASALHVLTTYTPIAPSGTHRIPAASDRSHTFPPPTRSSRSPPPTPQLDLFRPSPQCRARRNRALLSRLVQLKNKARFRRFERFCVRSSARAVWKRLSCCRRSDDTRAQRPFPSCERLPLCPHGGVHMLYSTTLCMVIAVFERAMMLFLFVRLTFLAT